jgi:hypothetical protein
MLLEVKIPLAPPGQRFWFAETSLRRCEFVLCCVAARISVETDAVAGVNGRKRTARVSPRVPCRSVSASPTEPLRSAFAPRTFMSGFRPHEATVHHIENPGSGKSLPCESPTAFLVRLPWPRSGLPLTSVQIRPESEKNRRAKRAQPCTPKIGATA